MNFTIKSLLLSFFLMLVISIQILAQNSDITIKKVKFESNNDTLAGSVLIPKNSFAALVIVHGSGQEKRMLDFASLLAKEGIAVLTYDKRGVGESGGIYAEIGRASCRERVCQYV